MADGTTQQCGRV